jgi:arsenate reductase
MRLPFLIVLILIPLSARGHDRRPDNEFLKVLWLVYEFGTPEAAEPANDVKTKAAIVDALRKNRILKPATVEGLMSPETFSRLAGDDGQLDPSEIEKLLSAHVPASRTTLLPRLASHARLLATGFDQIDETHRERSTELLEWIVKNYAPERPLSLLFVCTGNSRRSMLGSAMGNLAAAYYGLELRCYSGGTKPSAFNERTVATLQEIGFEVEVTGRHAERGPDGAPNPIYKVCWGNPVNGLSLEMEEFSKRYDDLRNPSTGFAAVLVCSEADASCPTVKGAAIRIAMPCFDPKLYDDTELESRKYAERRDDLGRLMMAVMMQARLRLVAAGKL